MEATELRLNAIVSRVQSLVDTFPKCALPDSNCWAPVSAFLLQDQTEIQCVAFGLGSKSLGFELLDDKGICLRDSHAEVLARRSFLRYVYSELNKLSTGCCSAFFEFSDDAKKAKLKCSVKIVFFTSLVPCGAATIIPSDSMPMHEHFNEPPTKVSRMMRDGDILRTGARCVQSGVQDSLEAGRAYHSTDALRTKPGRGPPSRSMSCSDKLARWAHVGVQGSLLVQLLDRPLFIDAIVVCSRIFDGTVMQRALYDRFVENQDLHCSRLADLPVRATLHHVKRPFSFAETAGAKSCPFALMWYKGQNQGPEVIVNGRRQGVTKKRFNTKSASLNGPE